MITGTYIYRGKLAVVDGPKAGDTLVLLNNRKFESNTWGEGTFEVINPSRIKLNYSYEYGEERYNTYFYRPLYFGKPRISIFRDLNYYFEKIK